MSKVIRLPRPTTSRDTTRAQPQGRDGAAFLSARDVAFHLGVSQAYVYQLMTAGTVPCVRVGRHLLVPRPAWDAWVDEQATRALEETAVRAQQQRVAEAADPSSCAYWCRHCDSHICDGGKKHSFF